MCGNVFLPAHLEESKSILASAEAKHGAITVLKSDTVLLARVKQTLSDVTSSRKRLAKQKCFQSLS